MLALWSCGRRGSVVQAQRQIHRALGAALTIAATPREPTPPSDNGAHIFTDISWDSGWLLDQDRAFGYPGQPQTARAGATKGGRNRQLTARGVRAQLASPMSSRSRRRISPAGRLQLRTCVGRDTLSGRAIDGCGQQSLPALQIAIRREPKGGARDRLYNAEFPRSRACPEPSCPAAISI